MQLEKQDLETMERLVRDAAVAELIPRFLHVEAKLKADGSLITEVDLQIQTRIQTTLNALWPDTPLLGEEMDTATHTKLLQDRQYGLWVLDPLDGTANFAAGIPFFGISLALLDERGVQAGVVLDPMRNESFSALRGQGAWLNGQPLRTPAGPCALGESMAMVDFKRLPEKLALALSRHPPYRSQRSFGSVALDWCWLAAGRVQVYLHGGQKLWDYAAGELILREAGACGGLYQDYHGKMPGRPSLTPRIAMAASSPSLFDNWRAWIEKAKGH
ncbi:inositol monophosphatase family protein [Thiolapillus sp.]